MTAKLQQLHRAVEQMAALNREIKDACNTLASESLQENKIEPSYSLSNAFKLCTRIEGQLEGLEKEVRLGLFMVESEEVHGT